MKRRSILLRVLAGFLILSLMCFPAGGTEAEDLEAQLEQLQEEEAALAEEIRKLESSLSENARQVGELVAQKDAIDQQINLLYSQTENITAQLAACSQLIADRQDALTAAQEALDQLSHRHRVRIRAMEESGDMSYWEVLFGSRDLLSFLDRLEMVQEIARSDRQRLEQLRQSAAAVESAKAALEAEKQRLKQARQVLAEAQRQMEDKRLESEAVLRSLLESGNQFRQMLEEAEQKQDALMQQIAATEDAYDDAKYQQWLESQKPVPNPGGKGWLCPVNSYVLTSPFGMRPHPILGIERMHNGIDMGCPAMTEIYASRGGVVSVAGYQADGAGNYVQIDHGDGYRSIYMHMTYYVVEAGEYVQQGQLIGYVGNTGLSKGAHLHFGISYQGTYVNPLEYIG